jgi:hypothetical protein
MQLKKTPWQADLNLGFPALRFFAALLTFRLNETIDHKCCLLSKF